MRAALYLSIFALLSCSSGRLQMEPFSSPVDFATEGGVYYFSDNDRKIASLESEYGEGTQFRYQRPSALVAEDLAGEEMEQGNVCLRQLESDLESALRKNDVENLCATVFQDEFKDAKRNIINAPPICTARAEAHHARDTLQLYLVLQLGELPHDTAKDRKVSSLGGSDFEKSNNIAVHKMKFGTAANHWKTLLKNGSCSLNDQVLASLQKDYLTYRRDRAKLGRCNYNQQKKVATIDHLQTQFKEYVPDEWLHEYRTDWVQSALANPSHETYTNLAECYSAVRASNVKLKKLIGLSVTISKKYDVSALNPYAGMPERNLSSIEEAPEEH